MAQVGCRGSHFLDIRLTNGGKVVSPTRRPSFSPRKMPGTHFCYRIRSIEKSNDLIGNRNRDLLVCRIVPLPTALLMEYTP
jgi:hypothetical protein